MQRNRPVILGAAILGLLAIGLTLMSLLRPRTATPPPGTGPNAAPTKAPTVKQVVPYKELPPRTLITRYNVHEMELPVVAGAPPVPSMTMEAAIGRLTSDIIRPGQPITAQLLTEPIKRTTPANFRVPTGTRGLAVMVDPKSTLGDLVDVGDRVDVVVVHKVKYKNAQQQENESRSGRTIARNLLVLATDPAVAQARATPPPAAAPGVPGVPGAPPAPPPPPTPPPPPGQAPAKIRVVLAAPPAEASRIAAAQESGNIHLTLRDPSEPVLLPGVPEAFEYPIRDKAGPARAGGNAPSNANAQPNRPSPQTGNATVTPREQNPQPDRPRQQGIVPPATWELPTPIPPPQPTAPPDAEVTVIRGTEKTRVLVPQR